MPRTNEEMAVLALAFYDAYMEEVGDNAEKLKSAFHGVSAAGAAFMGSLLGHFYEEHPALRHVFFCGISLKGMSLGQVGLFPGVWTREEAVNAWNACANSLVSSPSFFTDSEEGK